MNSDAMNIDFNHVRREAISAYSSLVHTLRGRADNRGRITVDRWEIENAIDDLRSALVGIGLTYEPDDSEFVNVIGDGVLPWLNPENGE